MEKLSYIDTTQLTRDEWLGERKRYIGGSDVAAVCGVSKWKTPLDVYNEKLGLSEPFAGNAATKAGLKLEDTIAEWYAEESGFKVVRDNKMRIHKAIPFLAANIDRKILKPDGYETPGVLEIKTAGHYAAKNWDEEPPVDYVMQLQHYLDVTGYAWGEFAVLIDGRDFRRYYQVRDEELIAMKNELLTKFWNENVLKQIPPAPINSEDIQTLYSRIEGGKTIEAAPTVAETIEKLRSLKVQIKDLKSIEDELTERVQLAMLDADAMVYNGDTLCTWKQSKDANYFDSKRFQSENYDLYLKYCQTKPGSRRFIVKGV